MAYLRVQYHQDQTDYALMGLDPDEMEIVGRALRELHTLYERMQAPEYELEAIQTLSAVLERRYGDPDE